MYYINGNGHRLELRSNRNYLTNHTKSKLHHYLLMALGVDTCTCACKCAHIIMHIHKPGAPGLKITPNNMVYFLVFRYTEYLHICTKYIQK